MVNSLRFLGKGIGESFLAQLLAPNSQSGKATAGQCKGNVWQGKMVPFLGLIKTCMANEYAPDQNKSGKDKVVTAKMLSPVKCHKWAILCIRS